MKFTPQTGRAASHIAKSNKCIAHWERVIAENIMSFFVSSAWSMIINHKQAIQREHAFIKRCNNGYWR